ncbi:short transient receptor potential channel 7-like isoform X2 [Lineus longissimus]|uniref:short transient receptor potential channel 7-like isoform X2 n=1 Tax=Lineus longissimus TaxID=88925 RepID=UPI002B4F9C80
MGADLGLGDLDLLLGSIQRRANNIKQNKKNAQNAVDAGRKVSNNKNHKEKKLPVQDASLNIFGDSLLTDTERRFLSSAESGILKVVRQSVEDNCNLNINCVDILGRTALQLAVLQEHYDVIQYLLGKCKLEVIEDALLHAIKNGSVKVCEIFLNHPIYSNPQRRIQLELTHGFYDHEDNNSDFSPDITPIVLAAHCNNFDIVFLLIQKGFLIPKPHHYFCQCTECINHKEFDRVVHSRSRLNAYKGLTSTAYMSLSSDDPIMTAFELSQNLTHLAEKEKEYKNEYKELSDKCKNFAVDLLDLCRTEAEVHAALHGDKGVNDLSRIKLSLQYEEKRFIAHASTQEHLMGMYYADVPYLRHQKSVTLLLLMPLGMVLMPFFAVLYFFAPKSRPSQIMRIPVVKFMNFTMSYFLFLILLFIATGLSGSDKTDIFYGDYAPVYIILAFYVAGMFWAEVKELWEEGAYNYIHDIWNLMDICMIAFYTSAFTLWTVREFRQRSALRDAQLMNPNVVRSNHTFEDSDPSTIDPEVLANIVFSVANVLSFSRIAYLLPATEQFGQLQISYGRMIQDVVKFLMIYATMLIAFLCGLTSLYSLYGNGTNYDNNHFSGIVETFLTLFWSTFGLGNAEAPRLSPIDNNDVYVEVLPVGDNLVVIVGYVLYGIYIMFTVVVLINMLIAMMSSTFEEIRADEDTEWKFARAKLWLSYFDEGTTLPIPFNIIPTPKSFYKLFMKIKRLCCVKSDDPTKEHSSETDSAKVKSMFGKSDYLGIMKRIVMRYVHTMKLGKKGRGKEDLQDFKEGMYSQLEQYHAKLEKKLNAVNSAITFVETEVLTLDRKISELFNCEMMADPREEVFEEAQEDKVPDEEEEANKIAAKCPETPKWNQGRFVKNPNKRYGTNLSVFVQNSIYGSSSGGSLQGNGLPDGSCSVKEGDDGQGDSDMPTSANDLAKSSTKKSSSNSSLRKNSSGFSVADIPSSAADIPSSVNGHVDDTEPLVSCANVPDPREDNSRPSSDEDSYQRHGRNEGNDVLIVPPKKPERHLYGGPFDNPVFDGEEELL